MSCPVDHFVSKRFLVIFLLCLCCSTEEILTSPLSMTDAVVAASDIVEVKAGCPDTDYENWRTSAYVLPFPVGKSYLVDLSHCSGSYHSAGQPDQFAIDFRMEVGEVVTAARSGNVIFVEESGLDGDFPNNLVAVKHDDGTFAQYMHLTKDGATVEVGTKVRAGDEIGLSGSTGLAGYPHLHFVVTKSGSHSYPYISLPTTFRNTEANEKSLVSGKTYTAEPY